MSFNLSMRSFTKLLDFTRGEIDYLLDMARDLKRLKHAGTERPPGTSRRSAVATSMPWGPTPAKAGELWGCMMKSALVPSLSQSTLPVGASTA